MVQPGWASQTLTAQSGSQVAPVSGKGIFSLNEKESLLLRPIQWAEAGNKEIPDIPTSHPVHVQNTF